MSNDNEDVLDFINSLPESKSGTPKPEGKEDFLEFLDELAAHEKGGKGKEKESGDDKGKGEVTKEDKKESEKSEKSSEKKPEKSSEKKPETPSEKKPEETPSQTPSQSKPDSGDFESSIASWWSKEGTHKVSNLWGSITSNAQNISETTYKLASDTTNQINIKRQQFIKDQEQNGEKSFEQINNLTNGLNSILTNITEQIVSNEDELINLIIINDDHFTYLNDLVYKNFNQVMNQVEGGIKLNINNFNNSKDLNTNLNMFYGKLIDGEKLCQANLESSIKNFNKVIEFEQQENTEINEKLEKINKSNVFIAIQSVTTNTGDEQELNEKELNEQDQSIDQVNNQSFTFIMILKDITNNITMTIKSQPFPLIWSYWLIGKKTEKFNDYPDIDPKEWVKDWIKNGLNLSIGILAQQYVIKRMGF